MKVLLIVVLIVLFIFIDKIVDFAFGCVRRKVQKQVSAIVDLEFHKYGLDNEDVKNNEAGD